MPGPHKLEAFGALLERRGSRWEETAFVGDDLADLQVLRRVGLPIAVANAVAEVKAVAAYVTRPPAATARCARSVEALLRPAASGPSCSSATSRSRRPMSFDPARARRRSAAGSSRSRRGAVAAAAERLDDRFARAVRAAGRCVRPGDRLRRRQVRGRSRGRSRRRSPPPARRDLPPPVDSLHGDFGMVGSSDVAIVLSKSGESEELFGLVGSLQRMGVPIIAITGAMDSMLARVATVALDAAVAEEACPHDLAPTTQHHRRPGAGRRARGGAAGGEGVPVARTSRALHPGRLARPEAAAPGARRDGAPGPRARARGDDAGGGGEPGPRSRARASWSRAAAWRACSPPGDLTRLAGARPGFLDLPVAERDDPQRHGPRRRTTSPRRRSGPWSATA